jgi:hypothetical protein
MSSSQCNVAHSSTRASARRGREPVIDLTWKSDHPPRHLHTYRDGNLVLKWDLDNKKSMKGRASPRVLRLVEALESQGWV